MNAGVRAVRAYANAMILSAAVWDVAGAAGLLPPWWPPVGYTLVGAGIAAACAGVLAALLTAPRGRRPAAGRSAAQLAAAGILLITWLLRGDAEIPPDPPLVAAQVVAALLYVVFTIRPERGPGAAAGGSAARDSP